MPTRLKVYLYYLSYMALAGLLVVCFAVPSSHWFGALLIFVFIFFVSLHQVIFVNRAFVREAKLARRWARITGRTYAEYPKTTEEKDAILGWATECLVERATKASDGFRERDALCAAFEKAKTIKLGSCVGANVPQALPKIRRDLRDVIARAYRDYHRAYLMASTRHESYLELWDLFRDMKMLPVDQTTGKAYTDPKQFRKSLKDVPVAPDDIAVLAPKTAS